MKRLISAISATVLATAVVFAPSMPARAITYTNGVTVIRNQTDRALGVEYYYKLREYTICQFYPESPNNPPSHACGRRAIPLKVPVGQSLVLDSCCTLAGTYYQYYFKADHLEVKAKICANHGLYGYSRVVVWKNGLTNDTGDCP